jgi:hypothetical protein
MFNTSVGQGKFSENVVETISPLYLRHIPWHQF